MYGEKATYFFFMINLISIIDDIRYSNINIIITFKDLTIFVIF